MMLQYIRLDLHPDLHLRTLAASLLISFLCLSPLRADADPLFETMPVFVHTFLPGGDPYNVVRIPSIVTAPNGDLLAFAEARPGPGDPGSGQIDIVYKRSTDLGKTWSDPVILAKNGRGDAANPTTLVDYDPNTEVDTVWLFYDKWPRGIGHFPNVPPGTGPDSTSLWARTSTDNGLTWSEEFELTDQIKPETWRVAGPGPGSGIQMRWGTEAVPAGRLVVPGWRTEGPNEAQSMDSFAFFSDDHGATWQLGGVTSSGTNESQGVELSDGSLLLDARQNNDTQSPTRMRYRSDDGGSTWSDPEEGLEVTPVMSSIVRYSAMRDGDDRDRLLFSAPSAEGRTGMRVLVSYDEGLTWTNETLIDADYSAYSVLAVLHDGTIGLLWESDDLAVISFARFNLEFLGEPVPEPEPGLLLLGAVSTLGLLRRRSARAEGSR